MSDRKYYMRRYGLTGGMDTSTNPFVMNDASFLYVKNMNHEENGSLSKDGGFSKFKIATTSATGDDMLFDYVNLLGVHTTLKISNGILYKADSGDNWVQVAAGATTAGNRVSAVNHLDRAYFCNGVNNLKYTSGSTVTDVATDNGSANVRGKYLEVLQNFIYVGHITTVHKRNEVVESLPGTHVFYNVNIEGHNTYTTTDRKITVDGQITGLKAYQGLLFIFTEDAIWYYNPDTKEVKRLADTGCVAHETIKEIDGVLYWANRNGVYRFSGEGMPTLVSLPITNWGGKSLWSLVDGSNWGKLCAGVHEGKYGLWLGDLTGALPGDRLPIISCENLEIENSSAGGYGIWYAGNNSIDGGGNEGWIFSDPPEQTSSEPATPSKDVVVYFDTYRGVWGFYDNHPVSIWASVVDGNGDKQLLFGSDQDGQTYIRDKSYTHDGAATDAVIRTKYFDFDNPENEKTLNDLFATYRPEGEENIYVDVSLAINGSDAYVKYLDDSSSTRLPLGGDVLGAYQFERVSLGGVRARTASYEFRNRSGGVSFTLLGFCQEFTYLQPNMNYTTG